MDDSNQETITEVHSITSANGFKFQHSNMPVACFALVSVVNPKHLTLGTNRKIIPLSDDMIGQDLIGHSLVALELWVEAIEAD